MSTDFSGVTFRGTFRNYQQKAIDNSIEHLNDRKIHIVAAPGSGKTILGLELIRRIGAPTLILSPSVTIRQQWGERFEERFLPEGNSLESFMSFDLKAPRLMTSVTYQALHAAYNRSINLEPDQELTCLDEEENSSGKLAPQPTENTNDFSDYDLLETIQARGIKVLCLDEAHHLRSEWQKALEAFVKSLKNDVIVISLTATPPYDSTQSEWNRYISLCGDIDDEIFVPELVKQKTLCPHQDYVYFNYPTVKEKEILDRYKTESQACCEEIFGSNMIEEALELSGILNNHRRQASIYFEHDVVFLTLFHIASQRGYHIPKHLFRLFRRAKSPKSFDFKKKENWDRLEETFQFIIDNPLIFSDEFSERLRKQLAQYGLIKRKRVYLLSDAKLNRMLIGSMGKLQSITQIALLESRNLGDDLRMLVLTDYIKKDLINRVGTEANFNAMGVVPILEVLRCAIGESRSVAALSGSLVVIPRIIEKEITNLAKARGLDCSYKPLPKCEDYSEVLFSGSNKSKVAVLTDAFQAGHIQILVGTKSLLGEGWDSPCINSLILASFVGSFMLSNQMRGRAIRVDHKVPNKTANIWHLVTVDPFFEEDASPLQKLSFSEVEHMQKEPVGEDWDTLIRRFDCFMGPAYTEKIIESGISRLDIIKAPFNRRGINRINAEMESRSTDRLAMANQWEDALVGVFEPKVNIVEEVSDFEIPLRFTLLNVLPIVFFAAVDLFIAYLTISLLQTARAEGSIQFVVMGFILVIVFSVLATRAAVKLVHFTSPRKVIEALGKAVLDTLKETGRIDSLGAKVRTTVSPLDTSIQFTLVNATTHEQNVFAHAMEEMLSPIESPKYLLIMKKSFLRTRETFFYWHSYSCPSILSQRKGDAELLQKKLHRLFGAFDLVYTHNLNGRDHLWKCCCFSFVNQNSELRRKHLVDTSS